MGLFYLPHIAQEGGVTSFKYFLAASRHGRHPVAANQQSPENASFAQSSPKLQTGTQSRPFKSSGGSEQASSPTGVGTNLTELAMPDRIRMTCPAYRHSKAHRAPGGLRK